MIDIIHLENFQSHRKTVVELSPGVNVFVGSSDCGKSAIVRALKWLGQNQPRGDSFFNHHADPKRESVVVAVHTTDGIEVGRMKGKIDGNIYYLDDDDYEVPLTSVPPEIASELNMSEVNWQFQHDRPFLLDSSAGEVARTLNRIANLQKIDQSLFSIDRKVRSFRTTEKFLEKEIADLQQRLAAEIDLEVLDEKMKKLADKEKRRESISSELDKLGSLANDIEQLEKDIASFKDYSEEEEMIDVLLEKSKKANETYKQRKGLMFLVRDIGLEQKKIGTMTKELADLEQEFHDSFPDICPLCEQEVHNA